MSITSVNVESVSSCRAVLAPETPKNRVKFMCSHGGKFLPRPADGRIKYVGGETRLICVPRDITFPELMKKLTTMFNGDRMILKYQLIPEDLDVLVTVKSDEDIRYMIEECDRFSSPKLRAFLFSSNPNKIQSMDHHSFEQSYINSVNGIIIHPSPTYNSYNTFNHPLPIYTTHTTVTISTTCSSSRAPPETTAICSTTNPEVTVYHGNLSELARNHSSPSLCDLGLSNHQNPVNHHQQPPPHHFHPHQPPKPPLNRHPHMASNSENLGRMRSGSSSSGHL